MKKALAYLLAASMTFGLVACGGNSGGAASTTSGGEASTAAAEASTAAEEATEADTSAAEATETEAPEETVEATVTIWHTYTDAQHEYLKKSIEEFNASHPGANVVEESQEYDGFTDKVYQAVMAGNGPDIIIHYASEAARYVADDKVLDLEQYLAPETVALMADGTRAEATSFSDGKMHILPIVSSGPILFYNKAIYEELGLSAPETWDDLQANCEAVKEAYPEKFGFAMDSVTDVCQTWIMQTGITIFDDEGCYFNTPEVAERLQYFQDNINNDLFTITKVGNYFSEDFNSERIVSYIGSAAGAPYLEIEFGMGKVPQGGAVNWTPAWNRGIIIFDYEDENRAKVAAAFTDYFASAEVNAGWCEACNYPATFEATMATQTYKDFVANNESFSYLHPEYAGAFPAVTRPAYVRNALQMLMEDVAGGKDINTSLEDAIQYVEDEMEAE